MKIAYRRGQRGATLIVVLILLLLITILGILAIRTAITSLNIATNSQIGQLLVQTGDAPTNQFINVSTYEALKKRMSSSEQQFWNIKVRQVKNLFFATDLHRRNKWELL